MVARLSSALALRAAEIADSDVSADTRGYYPAVLTSLTLPHSNPGRGVNTYSRRDGNKTLHVVSPVGVPYGSIPRLLIAWVATEAKRLRSPELDLGSSVSDFAANGLHLSQNSASLGRLRNQTTRLFTSHISVIDDRRAKTSFSNMLLADDGQFFWEPHSSPTRPTWKGQLVLSQRFFSAILSRPYPIDLRVIHSLQRSPLAIDIYIWLPWRMYSLTSRTIIPWSFIAAQFGSCYTRDKDFRAAFCTELKKVLGFYRARVEPTVDALVLWPSPLHIPPRRSGPCS